MKKFLFFLLFALLSTPCSADVYQCGNKQLSIKVDVPPYWRYAPAETGCKFFSQKHDSDFIAIMSTPNFPGSPQQVANAQINDMKQGKAHSAAGIPIVYRDFVNRGDTCVVHASVSDNPIQFITFKKGDSLVVVQTAGDNYEELAKILDSLEFSR